MFPLREIRYVRLGTANLDHAVEFATRILGLQVVERAGDRAFLRSDSREHTLCYVAGAPAEHVVGFEIEDGASLDAVAELLGQAKIDARWGTRDECDERRVHRLIRFKDRNGTTIEAVERGQVSGWRYFPARDAGITGFSHIGLHSGDLRRDQAFWTGVCGARVSDWIGDAALLRINPVHHTLALFPSQRVGVQHVNHQVESIDDIMRSWYFLREQGVRIVFGPGRHPTSSAVFLYFDGPDGVVYEYSCGVKMITDEANHHPRQFPFSPAGFCMWGSKPDVPEFRH